MGKVLFDTAKFLLDSSFFTNAQAGQYMKLLCNQHQNGTISPELMIQVIGDISSPVATLFEVDDKGQFYNKRMKEAAEKRVKYCASRSNPKKKEAAFVKPDISDIYSYFVKKGQVPVEADKFFDFYESKGWMVGKNKMRSWESAVRNWIRRSNENGNKGSSQQIKSESGKYGNIDTV